MTSSDQHDDDSNWESCFEKLLLFKKRNGHTKVPKHFSEDLKLAAWVAEQRKDYKQYVSLKSDEERMELFESGAVALNPACYDRLASIGFETSNKNPRHLRWDFRYQQLKKFVEEFGHTQVPIGWEENVKLSNWVSTQRQEYKNMQNNRPSQLTEQRIELLNDIGFAWEVQRGGRRRRLKPCSPRAKAGKEAGDIIAGKTLMGGTDGASKPRARSLQDTKPQRRERKSAATQQTQPSPKPHTTSPLRKDTPSISAIRQHQLEQEMRLQEQMRVRQQHHQALLASQGGAWPPSSFPRQSFPSLAVSQELWSYTPTLSPRQSYHYAASHMLQATLAEAAAVEMMLAESARSRLGADLMFGTTQMDMRTTSFPYMDTAGISAVEHASRPAAAAVSSARLHPLRRRRSDPPVDPPDSDSASSGAEEESGQANADLGGEEEHEGEGEETNRSNKSRNPTSLSSPSAASAETKRHTTSSTPTFVSSPSAASGVTAPEEKGRQQQFAVGGRFKRASTSSSFLLSRSTSAPPCKEAVETKPKRSSLVNLSGSHFEDAENDDTL